MLTVTERRLPMAFRTWIAAKAAVVETLYKGFIVASHVLRANENLKRRRDDDGESLYRRPAVVTWV